ncbi:uncharacterized protein SPPG_06446 [Spizellomyces punctatus DAOM BR117]|uniref:Uncharacterized protein n=1 Tax=Spizellomyces punctatus (strain DAOM BR117) TaxID=645134 RepID=A0A0L0HA18_SPIPD|nr:uncharacterized protein SPPG_06446 [Spizellomyces punctatus DAOM BR117]KNC98027.1 hypothetical protein SPPG_06446 [Spizellomyces punctatus DAOM BR117]|eukprot:XP_016606067.1 hypothetical protein SPPG_06446 [Spizellomyces punctatus DAOM BR117]
MEADWIVEEIESRGLLFLCSQVPSVRKQAIRILQFADQFERALKGRPMDDLEEQFPGLTKAEARRQTLRRQSRNDLRRQYTLQRNVYNAQMDVGRSRIGRIMEECGPDLVRRHYHDPVLAASTRSEHQKLQQQQRQQQYLNVVSAKDTLIHIAGSDVQQDAIIWNRCFPDLIKWCFQYASPRTLQLCLRDVCSRLLVMQASIVSAAEQTGGAGKVSTGTVKWANDRTGFGGSGTNKGLTGTVLSLTDEMVDQWKVYMVFACASIEITRATAETSAGHGVVGVSGSFLERDRTDPFSMEPGAPQRLLSKATGSAQPIASAHQLFQMVFPLLSSERSSIRQAAVTSLGAIHWLSYQTFLEDVQSYMKSVVDDLRAKAAMGKGENKDSGRKAGSSQALAQTAQTKRFERVRMELTHVLSLVADFVDHVQYRRNDSLMTGVITYIREMARFLSDADVQLEWDHQMLRYYYSGFIERFYDHLVAAVDSSDDGTNFSRESENMERYMPYDLRLGLFRLFEQWCGYGQYRGRTREREAKMMLSVLDQVKDIRERGALTSTMEEQRKALETASLKAMAALCKGPIVNPRDSAVGFEFKALVSWIDSIFASPDEKFHVIARAALEALLTHNRKNEQLLSDVVRQCYIGDVHSNVTVGYFMALVDIFVREEAYPCAPSRMCALALYKAGDPNLHIRRGSVRLLRAIENRFWGDKTNKAKYGVVRNLVKEFFGPPPQLSDLDAHMLEHRLDPDGNDGWDDEAAIMAAMALIDEEHATYEAAAIASSLPIVYKYAQAMVSARLASERGEMTHEMLSEMVLISELVANGNGQKSGNPHGVRDILIFMVPWVRNVELAPIPTDGALRGTSEIVMTNLFYLTVKYGDEYVTEIENLWAQLVEPVTESNEGNDGDREAGAEDLRSQSRDGADSEAYAIIERHVSTAVEYLLNVGVQKRNPNFVRHAKKVMVYLARTLACAQLVDALVERITPQSLVPSGISGDTSTPAIEMTKTKHLPRPPLYMADLEQVLIDMPKRPAFSKGQLACVLLVDLAVEVGAALRPHLPLLLHIIFVQLDHFITLICEQNRLLLINLIQSIVPRDVAGEHIDTVHAALSLKEGKRLWPYEDITPKNHDIESEHQLGALVVDVLDLLSVVDCDLVQSWGETALAWATSCPVRHVACRSLQIFRTLMPAFSQRMLGELLQRLANTLADPTEEIQGFALENIMTLTAMIDSLDGYRLILFPQFFWAAVACIHSPHEWEYLEGVRLLEKILKKLNLDDPSCRNILLINLPTKWRGQFTGLQSLLLRGLSSSVTEQSSLRLINSLVFLDDGSLVDTSNTRVLFTLLANLPRWMQTFEADPSAEGGKAAGATIEECTAVAAAISEFVGKKGHAGIARLMSSYAKQRFRSKEDFLRQFLSLIKDAFFPTHEVDALQFLMGLLSNSHRFYRRRVLAIIKFMLPTLDSCRPAFGGGGQPLLALNSLDEELIAPLLTILQTDLAIEALEVLDEALSGTIAIGESNLRLVFGGKSIYKIAREGGAQVDALPAMLASPAINNTTETVEDSGWRVKDFNATARVARYNMTGVASTCGGAHDLAGLGRKTSYSGGVADRDSGRGVRPSPTSNILVGGSTRERRGSQPDKILNDQSASGKLELWALDDVNGNLLDTLNDLNAFFGQDDNFEQDFEESGVIAGSQSQRNSAGFDGESISGIFTSSNSSLSTETVTGETVAKSRKVSLSSLHSEVSYSAESLGPALTRDTSMSSLFVNGILGDYDPFGNGHDEDDDDEVSTETSVDGRRHGRSMGHGRSASAALAPLPDTSIPGSTMTTPARRLLSQHGALAFVTFRIQTRYEQLVQDAEFGHWLRADLAGVLRVDSERVVLERVEAEVGANGGVLVTAAVKGEEEGGGGIESAAYAEELAALIVGGEEEGDEGKALYQGVVTYNVDKTWIPEILIGFMGITVPYLPEGLRYELPYRQQHRRDLKLQSLPSSPIPNPHPLTPPLEPTRTQPSLEQNQRTVLTAETAIEVFRIFPASFELVVQLLEDWLGFAGDLLSSGVRSKEIERLAAMVGGMRNVEDGNVYKPPLVGDGEDGEQALEGVAERLLAYQQVDPDYLQAFLDARQRHVTVMNSQVSGYLSRRHAMSELGDMSNAVERERVVGEAMELASQVVKLYLEVLQLEGLLERFLGVGQERRTREMAVARECCEVCVTIRTA